MGQSFACLHTHMISAPNLGWQPSPLNFNRACSSTLGEFSEQERRCLVAAGGVADHVHLLVSLSREISIAQTVRLIKSNSSRWIHDTFADQKDFAWQTGYGVFAVSFSHLENVKKYLARQQEHHRKTSFQDEFRAFLRRHNIEFDERYVWD